MLPHASCRNLTKIALLLFISVVFVGCGGGGGGGGGNSNPVFDLTPASIDLTQGEDESLTIEVLASPNISFNSSVYVYIIDSVGVIEPAVDIVDNGDNTYSVTLTTNAALSVGVHTGSVQIRVCMDASCVNQYPGSPMSMSYRIEVVSSTNITPLSPWASVGAWETFQRDNAHTGYVPVTLDSANFSPRWRWVAPETDTELRPVVAANGRVYVVSSGFFASTSVLYALNEYDSSESWYYNIGSVFRANDPGVSGGNVYVATSGHADTAMWSFTADTGVLNFSTPFESQWEAYYAPVVDGGMVYTNGGYYGGVNAFNISDGSDAWFTSLLQYDEWTPAVDETNLYAIAGGVLSIINKTTGVIENTISDTSFEWNGWSMKSAPIIGSDNNILTINQVTDFFGDDLVSYNLGTLSMNWNVPGNYITHPALANGVIYVTNRSPLRLEARSEYTGELLWSWVPPLETETTFYGNVVATDNLVFVSTNQKVYAIDLATHESTWSYWRPGNLTISNQGILYITTSDGSASNGALAAINLQ